MSTEDLALPPPSSTPTPDSLTPTSSTPTPQTDPADRDPIIQRSAVFGSRYLTDPTKVFDYNSWDQVQPDPTHLALALEKIKFQHEHALSPKEKQRFLDRPAYFWDMFYRNNRENFFKNRKWLTREFPMLRECMYKDVSSPKPFKWWGLLFREADVIVRLGRRLFLKLGVELEMRCFRY